MGYYKETDNVYSQEYYVIQEETDKVSYPNNIRLIEKTPIVIINNESINFNLKNYILYNYDYNISEENIIETEIMERDLIKEETTKTFIKPEIANRQSNYSKIRIKIDFGDDSSIISNKPLTYKGKDSWDIINHHYSFSDKKFFEKNFNGKIIITINNIENLKDIIIIPFKIEKLSAATRGIKMDLISANLTNDNNISFTFNILNDNQIVFATNKENS